MLPFLTFTEMSMSYVAEMNVSEHMSFKLVLLKPESKYSGGMQPCAQEYKGSQDKPLPRMSILFKMGR